MTDQNCGTCRFFGPGSPLCHRFPPTALMLTDGENHLKSFFPVTSSTNFCGEWQPLDLGTPSEPANQDEATELARLLVQAIIASGGKIVVRPQDSIAARSLGFHASFDRRSCNMILTVRSAA